MRTIYSPNAVRDGCVLHLDAANPKSYLGTGTTWFDLSGNANDGTITSSPIHNSGSFTFDGIDDYIVVNNSPELNNTNITIICWARSNTLLWNSHGMLVSKRDVFVLHPNADSTNVGCYCYIGGAWANASINFVPNITAYNMYAYSWDGTNILSYLNGSLSNSRAVAGSIALDDTGGISIGRDDSIGRYLNGDISIVQIYNRALSAQEVAQNFEAMRGRYGI